MVSSVYRQVTSFSTRCATITGQSNGPRPTNVTNSLGVGFRIVGPPFPRVNLTSLTISSCPRIAPFLPCLLVVTEIPTILGAPVAPPDFAQNSELEITDQA